MPFALLACVQLLSMAALVALAACAYQPRRRGPASPWCALGALLLAGADVGVGLDLGAESSRLLAVLRLVGGLVLALALATGALSDRTADPPRPGLRLLPMGRAGLQTGAPLAVAPLAAPVPLATAAALALAVAAAASLRLRLRGQVVWALSAALGLHALAAGLGAGAQTSTGFAAAVLVSRGAASALLVLAVVYLTRDSVLAKVVVAILAAALMVALLVVGVVGQLVSDAVRRDQAQRVATAAKGQAQAVSDDENTALAFARVLASCPQPAQCVQDLGFFATQPAVAVVLDGARGAPVATDLARPGQRNQVPLDAGELRTLAGEAVVAEVLRTGQPATGLLVLVGQTTTQVVAVGVAPGPRVGDTPPTKVGVYGLVLDGTRLATGRVRTGLDTTLITSDGVAVASSLDPDQRNQVAALAASTGALRDVRDPRSSASRLSEGKRPTVAFSAPDSGPDAGVLIAVSAPSENLLRTQRVLLEVLFLVLVVICGLVGVLALVLGQRLVEPIRRLTAAAAAVRSGDLSAATGVATRDELGELSRTFDAMTTSLAYADSTLRAAAQEEAALRLELETVVSAMSDGLVVADADGRVLSANPAAAALLGPRAVGSQLAEVIRGTATSGGPLLPNRPAAAGVLRREGELASGPGARLPVALSSAPLGLDGGVVITLRDLVRERQVDRMKTEFLSNISHELRTPLTPIQGFAEVLRRRPDLPDHKVGEYAALMADATRRLTRVVDLLVDVAALEAGRVRVNSRVVAPEELVAARVADRRRQHPERSLDIAAHVEPGLPQVLVDPALLAKAMDELVGNAVRFSELGSPITVFAQRTTTADRLAIGVRDRGQGLDSSQVQALLADFTQADGSATRQHDGLGLGLAFVRRVADTAGFTVDVDATRGEGACFALLLPTVREGHDVEQLRAATAAIPEIGSPRPPVEQQVSDGDSSARRDPLRA